MKWSVLGPDLLFADFKFDLWLSGAVGLILIENPTPIIDSLSTYPPRCSYGCFCFDFSDFVAGLKCDEGFDLLEAKGLSSASSATFCLLVKGVSETRLTFENYDLE